MEKCQRGGPQRCILWRGQERLWTATRRVLWLLLAKLLAKKRIAVRVTPKTIRAARRAVMLAVVVVWAGAPVPRLNTAEPHRITLCRCAGPARAEAVADRLQTRGAPRLRDRGVIREQLARDVWLFRTARRVEGLQRLVGALREAVLNEDLAFEPDARGLHVSL